MENLRGHAARSPTNKPVPHSLLPLVPLTPHLVLGWDPYRVWPGEGSGILDV